MLSKINVKAPIMERIKELFRRNVRYYQQYKRESLKRQKYLQLHPTMIAVFKCMDGRVHFPLVTNFLIGIIKPFRRLGGKFNLGWPHLSDVFLKWVQEQLALGKSCLVIVSYHFSKGDPKRGCAGFNFDTAAALDHQLWFRDQIRSVFASVNNNVYPIVIGLETDSDALVIHGEAGQRLDLSERLTATDDAIFEELCQLFPDMPQQMLLDLMPLIEGNIAHIKERQATTEIIEVEHNEWVIAFGTGFDWLHAPNTAIIIGPWHMVDLGQEIRVALRIIQGNMKAGRIPDDGFIFLVSSEWQRSPEDRLRAEKVKEFTAFAKTILEEEEFADIAPTARFISGIVDDSKKLALLPGNAPEFEALLESASAE